MSHKEQLRPKKWKIIIELGEDEKGKRKNFST